ncbi:MULTISPECIES: calcium:proton antiporter [unclassified Streptomyces]|uniref:calcium:proton antiporter n=1 Tax=unclassified Streptomyces TaxID=2593676 RepID=UPI00224F3D8C|nr:MULTISPECIES: ionic transporter y4hA [unclassified Streptomyces]MCX4524360.1 ionic transporter y4hA [Streptomyces sp. NBC_01551]MCX4545119.1 ionic transporter y4hA [Streptomyces sp. NBC_01565]
MSTATSKSPLTDWTLVVPVVALVALIFSWGRDLPSGVVALVAVCLGGAVLAAVHHAEVVALRVGEPFGSLVLAVAVTVIEVALIVTLMADGGPKTSSLARDTVFAAVMITCNGIVGLSLLVGALRNRVAVFNAEGSGAALATVATLAVLSLVLPTFTTSKPGPEFSTAQLAFAAVASLCLYGVFIAVQTVRHRDYFLPVDTGAAQSRPAGAGAASPGPEDEGHADPPSARDALISLGLLLVALVAVVGDAKAVSPTIEAGVASAGLPGAVVGVIIALLVLAPETLAAVRAARRDRVQTSLNLAYGSAIASIGLTIPAIALASIWLSGPLLLGLGPIHMVLLALTVVVSALTIVPGRATLLQAGVHIVLLAAYLFLAVSP